jgi:hypothetical protein
MQGQMRGGAASRTSEKIEDFPDKVMAVDSYQSPPQKQIDL